MSLCLKPKVFHFTKDYNICPVFNFKPSYFKQNSTLQGPGLAPEEEMRDFDKNFDDKNFTIRGKNHLMSSKNAVKQELRIDYNRKNSTFNAIENFFARRKSFVKKTRLSESVDENSEKAYELQGKRLNLKVEDSMPNQSCSSTFDFIETRNSLDRRKSVSIQADINSTNYSPVNINK